MIFFLKKEYVLIKLFIYGSILYLPTSLILSSIGYEYLNTFIKLSLIALILFDLLILKIKENIEYKIFFFLILSIFFLKNFYTFKFLPSFLVNLSGFIAFCSLLVCFKKFDFKSINKINFTIISLISILTLLVYGKIWHLISIGNFDNFYRLVMPFINPNFASTALVINLIIFNLICSREKYLLLINILFAIALALLGSRTGSLAYIFASFFVFSFKNFDKKLFLVIIISLISCFYSFHSRGDFLEDNFDIYQERESLSRFEQFLQSGIIFINLSKNKILIANNINEKFDRNFNLTNKNIFQMNTNTYMNKNFDSENFDSLLSEMDNLVLKNKNNFPYVLFIGNSFGLHTNNYFNLYALLSRISLSTKDFHLTFFPRYETTTYNTLTFLLYNGGLLLVILFTLLIFIIPLYKILKENIYKNNKKLILCHTNLVLIILTFGASFPLTELTPYVITLILLMYNIKTIPIDN